jgi:DNA-binding NarL/FixJ family response regulator
VAWENGLVESSALMNTAIVEDQLIYQRYLANLVEGQLGFKVVFCGADGNDAMQACPRLGVELLILDLKIEGLYGLDLARTLMEQMRQLKILAFSGELNAYNLRMVEAIGIHGYIYKSDPALEQDVFLVQAIQKVSRGMRVFSPLVAQMRREQQRDADAFHKVLSPKKIEILKLIARCLNDQEISDVVDLSVHTVRKHRSEMMQQLNITSTHQLIRYAQRHGFGNEALQEEGS